MKRAVFMDRDGTISEEVGYIGEPDQFHGKILGMSPGQNALG